MGDSDEVMRHESWGMGHGAWGMGHGAWGMGHGGSGEVGKWGMGHGGSGEVGKWGSGLRAVRVRNHQSTIGGFNAETAQRVC